MRLLFLNFGKIGYVEGQKFPRQEYVADAGKAICTLPLEVLVNKSTAGPAELIAGAILDNNRGELVGDKTFGSASIQRTIPLSDGGALILSVAKYYTPTGKVIQDTAITPTIIVADAANDELGPEDSNLAPSEKAKPEPARQQPDEQLRRAIEQLNKPAPAKPATAAAKQ